MSRTAAVVRMHLSDRLTIFGMPPAILAASFLVNILMFAAEPVEGRHTGGAVAIYCVVIIAAVMMTSRGMSFALSMGASRRSFATGTGIIGALLALVFGALLFVLNRVESATDGWGLRGQFFSFAWLDRHLAGTWLLGTVGMLAVFLIGAWLATVWLRWHQAGMAVLTVATVLVFGGGAALATWQDGWGAIGRWFAALTPLSASGWSAALCAVLAAAGYATLRRIEV